MYTRHEPFYKQLEVKMNRVRFCVMKLEYKYRINTKMTNRSNCVEAVVVVIIWQLDLHLPMQSVLFTTKVVCLNPAHGEEYSIQHYVI